MFIKLPKIVRGWKKVLAAAFILVACEPFNPFGTCGDVPSCSAVDYRFALSGGLEANNGDYQIMWPGFRIQVATNYRPQSLACQGSGRGVAYALSCEPCTGPGLVLDSLVVGTDILLPTGDTLKAGYNFPENVALPGIQGNRWDLLFDAEYPARFRDSVFTIRFVGHADTLQKADTRTVIIRNPALLYP